MGQIENFITEFEKRGFTIMKVSVGNGMTIVECNNIAVTWDDLNELRIIRDCNNMEWTFFEMQLNFTNGDDVTLLFMYH